MNDEKKIIIYQVFTRLFGNNNNHCVYNGDISTNGCGKMADFTLKALGEIKKLGSTHIWYTGIIEHATQTDYRRYNISPDHPAIVKGKAGSPYAIKDYYDVDPDLANDIPERMREFENLVRRTHRAGLKVIIDFVPNHVARQYHSDAQPDGTTELGANDDSSQSFSPYNNFYYIPQAELRAQFDMKDGATEPYHEFPAKATGNNRFDATPNITDWYETIKLNYGVDYQNGGTCHFSPIPDTWIKMLDILLFWASKNIDGFRCDMAEMVPVEFWNWVIPKVKQAYDVCFIAEVYNPAEYRNYIWNGHFDYLYDKVGLYDTVRAVMCNQAPASNISGCWQSLEGIQHNMLNFLENHDEQRIASYFFAGDPRPGIPGMIVSAMMNTNPVMIYSGQELGEPGMDDEGFSGRDGRTTIFDYWSLASLRNWINEGAFDGGKLTAEQRQLREVYAKILNISKSERVITEGVFYDLMYANLSNPYFNSHRQFVFMRKYQNEVLLVVVNFDKAEQTVRIQIPDEAFKALDFGDNKAAVQTDLMTGENCISTLTAAWPYQVVIPAYSGRLLKFTY